MTEHFAPLSDVLALDGLGVDTPVVAAITGQGAISEPCRFDIDLPEAESDRPVPDVPATRRRRVVVVGRISEVTSVGGADPSRAALADLADPADLAGVPSSSIGDACAGGHRTVQAGLVVPDPGAR